MAFEEWLAELRVHAMNSAAETRKIAADSWGSGYDTGYSDALELAAHFTSPALADTGGAEYRNVIDEALVVRHLGIARGNPHEELNTIISWEVAVALDPRVSEAAQALIDKGAAPTGRVGEPVAWRCFHCDEVFTDPKAAANHFGVDHVGDETLCQMAQVDGGIAKVIADLAEELQRYRSEDNTSYREFYALGADHRVALIKEEQKGYDRGLADARTDAAHPDPQAERTTIERLTDVVMMLDAPDAYNRRYIAAVCRSILTLASQTGGEK